MIFAETRLGVAHCCIGGHARGRLVTAGLETWWLQARTRGMSENVCPPWFPVTEL